MKVVAHRGASAEAPENTMASFVAAKHLGADAVELDVQCSADGELFVVHDYAVDRTTDGSGLVSTLPSEVLAALDAGSWFGPAFSGERIPRLEDVLQLADVEFEVELKVFTRSGLERAYEAVAAAGAVDRTEFTSWNTPMLIELKQQHPAARIGLFSRRQEGWMPGEVYEETILAGATFTPADVVHVQAGDITARIAERLHDRGCAVHANDAATAEEVLRAQRCGADRTSVDDPRMALAVLGGQERYRRTDGGQAKATGSSLIWNVNSRGPSSG